MNTENEAQKTPLATTAEGGFFVYYFISEKNSSGDMVVLFGNS
jgi:hypothetical protein